VVFPVPYGAKTTPSSPLDNPPSVSSSIPFIPVGIGCLKSFSKTASIFSLIDVPSSFSEPTESASLKISAHFS
jgi:hypothetical protein